jgi:hypothetical protein
MPDKLQMFFQLTVQKFLFLHKGLLETVKLLLDRVNELAVVRFVLVKQLKKYPCQIVDYQHLVFSVAPLLYMRLFAHRFSTQVQPLQI